MLLERWQKPKTAGALAERWPGGRKKVSVSVPIFLFLYYNLLSFGLGFDYFVESSQSGINLLSVFEYF